MSTKIFVLITNLGVVKVHARSNVKFMTQAEQKLQNYFEQLMVMAENTSKSSEDSILLAGAFMSAARVLYFNNLNPQEANSIIEANTVDFIELIKPTIH